MTAVAVTSLMVQFGLPVFLVTSDWTCKHKVVEAQTRAKAEEKVAEEHHKVAEREMAWLVALATKQAQEKEMRWATQKAEKKTAS